MAAYILASKVAGASGVIPAGTVVWDGVGARPTGAVHLPGFTGHYFNSVPHDAGGNTAMSSSVPTVGLASAGSGPGEFNHSHGNG